MEGPSYNKDITPNILHSLTCELKRNMQPSAQSLLKMRLLFAVVYLLLSIHCMGSKLDEV